jgi:FtsP/CotA-like multicopper oxidase with cupredoxin domain
MYHCHFEDIEHVTMGMHGIVFVKPDPADTLIAGPHAQKAYGIADGDLTGETGYDREYAIMLNEIDTRAHFGDAHIQETNWTDFHADIWTFNGRAYPDTLAPNGIRDDTGLLIEQSWDGTYSGGAPVLQQVPEGRLADNPLSSLVMCSPGERVLIRFANLGMINHTIVFPGLAVDVLGRDARYVPPSAQRKATDSIQIGPGESRDVFFTAPAAGTYAFYDRGMSHYRGSADGTDGWVGGQRSDIVVVADLAAQLKPNGWPGEAEWPGEFPVLAQHDAPALTATGVRIPGGGPNSGRFLDGTATADSQSYLADVWWVDVGTSSSTPAPAPGDPAWNSSVFNPDGTFHIRVANAGNNANNNRRWYYIQAQDAAGVYSTMAHVRI